jgi:eukaryotic-like serine/threonine-protein kinase
MTAFDRDTLIRLALAPADEVTAPRDLADEIARVVAVTPQRRVFLPRLVVGRWLPSLSPATVLALLVVLLLVAIVAALASRPPTIPPSLTTYHGGPEHTGVMPGPGPAGAPRVAWTADLSGRVPVTVMPVVAGGRVDVADESGTISVFDVTTGVVVDRIAIGSPVQSSPTVAGELLIVGADDGSLTAIELGSRRIRWHTPVASGPIRASLLALDDLVYAGSDDGTLYVVDASSGTVRRSMAIGGPVNRGPAVAQGRAYVGTGNGLVVAVDVATGQELWRRSDLGPGAIGTPTFANGSVYVSRGLQSASGPYAVLALSATDGTDRWPSPFEPQGVRELVVGAVGDGTVFVMAKDGFVYALDEPTGQQRWAPYDSHAGIGTLAGLVDHVLYITNDGRTVQAIDAATGHGLWSISVAGTPTMPAVVDGRVIVATGAGKVVAIEGSVPPRS